MILRKLFLGIILFGFLNSEGQNQTPLQRFLHTPGLENASIGIEIRQVSDNKKIVSFDAQRSLMPASVQKVVTTATALQLLGSDYRFKTSVYLSGRLLSNGVFEGDLIVKGGGDPSLESRYSQCPTHLFFNKIVDSLRSRGIHSIRGRLIADAREWGTEVIPSGWTWEDMGNYYAAGIYAINYHDNFYNLVLDTSSKNKKPQIKSIQPEVPGLVISNHLHPKSVSSDSAYLYGAPFSNVRQLYGAVSQTKNTFTIKGDFPDPQIVFLNELKSYFQSKHISVSDSILSIYEGDDNKEYSNEVLQPLLVYKSEPLSFLVRQTNLYSINLYAEAFLKAILPIAKNSSAEASVSHLLHYWKNQNISTQGLFLYDGSGLSPKNRLTAHFLSELLVQMAHNKTFVSSLPKVGKEGTLKNFLQGTALEGRAFLKSGTIKQVVSYAGYIQGSQLYTVVMIVNNANISNASLRKAMERFLLDYNW